MEKHFFLKLSTSWKDCPLPLSYFFLRSSFSNYSVYNISSQFLLVWKCLCFVIFLKSYFSWVYNSWLTIIFFWHFIFLLIQKHMYSAYSFKLSFFSVPNFMLNVHLPFFSSHLVFNYNNYIFLCLEFYLVFFHKCLGLF